MDLLESEIDDDGDDDDDDEGEENTNGVRDDVDQQVDKQDSTSSSSTSPHPPTNYTSPSKTSDSTTITSTTTNRSPPRNTLPRVTTSSSQSSSIQQKHQQQQQQQHQHQSSRSEATPQTPPPNRNNLTLSPPSPPGRRFAGGLNNDNQTPIPIPPGIRSHGGGVGGAGGDGMAVRGRYVPHVVTISLDTSLDNDNTPNQFLLQPPHHPNSYFNKKQKTPIKKEKRPRLGQLLQACPLDGTKASAVTCVKFSPSTQFCLIGYGVREPIMTGDIPLHPVTALYCTKDKMTHISTMLSADDDVNIARFHPSSGMGFCYGTKQGRVRVLSPRPWNYYDC